MLNFDLMDTAAGRQIYDKGMEKGVKKVFVEAEVIDSGSPE